MVPRGDNEVVRCNLASPGWSQPLIPRLTRVDGGTGVGWGGCVIRKVFGRGGLELIGNIR